MKCSKRRDGGNRPAIAAGAQDACVIANAIGLSLEEGPGDPLEAGAVYAVTSSATEGGETAYASALVAVREDGCDELWRQTA